MLCGSDWNVIQFFGLPDNNEKKKKKKKWFKITILKIIPNNTN